MNHGIQKVEGGSQSHVGGDLWVPQQRRITVLVQGDLWVPLLETSIVLVWGDLLILQQKRDLLFVRGDLAVWKSSLDNCRWSTFIPSRTTTWNVTCTWRWRRSKSHTLLLHNPPHPPPYLHQLRPSHAEESLWGTRTSNGWRGHPSSCRTTFFRPQHSTTVSPKRFKYSSFYQETDAYHSAEHYSHSASDFSRGLVSFPDQWLWSLVWKLN